MWRGTLSVQPQLSERPDTSIFTPQLHEELTATNYSKHSWSRVTNGKILGKSVIKGKRDTRSTRSHILKTDKHEHIRDSAYSNGVGVHGWMLEGRRLVGDRRGEVWSRSRVLHDVIQPPVGYRVQLQLHTTHTHKRPSALQILSFDGALA
jgi:hypothetical protein